MTKLLLTSVLALPFFIPGVSFGADSIFGVNVPFEEQVVKSNVPAGSYIAKDHTLAGTLVPQKLINFNSSVSSDEKRRDSYYVFGVDINSENQI